MAEKLPKAASNLSPDTALLLQSRGNDRRFTTNDVRRIARRGHAVRVGAVAGLVAGFATGTLWAVQQPCEFTCFSNAGSVLVFGAIGAGIGLAGGAALGAAFRKEQVLFERAMAGGPSATVTVKLPTTAKGVLVQIDW